MTDAAGDPRDVRLEIDPDGVAVVTLARPEARNAMRVETWRALAEAIDDAAALVDVRALVITGEGAFCAGGDLRSPGSIGGGVLAATGRLQAAHQTLRRLRMLRVPTVAAVEGYAIGIGWSIALVCDSIVAAENAYFQAPFLERALVPDGGFAWLASRAVGEAATLELLVSGRRLAADEALRRGLAGAVVPPGAALARALERARMLAALPADALRLTRELVRRAATRGYDEFLADELPAVALADGSPDRAEGLAAFVQKRTPDFRSPATADAAARGHPVEVARGPERGEGEAKDG